MYSISAVTRWAVTLSRAISRMFVQVAVALLPKCGLCVMAYLNLFGLMGLSVAAADYYKWIFPAFIAAPAIHLFIVYAKAKRRKNYRLFFYNYSEPLYYYGAE